MRTHSDKRDFLQPKGLQCIQRICTLCPYREHDSPEHVLLRCETLALLRNALLLKVIFNMPNAMKLNFDSMTPHRKVVFLLSGFQCGYTSEWSRIYAEVANFVYRIYKERYKKYNENSLE